MPVFKHFGIASLQARFSIFDRVITVCALCSMFVDEVKSIDISEILLMAL